MCRYNCGARQRTNNQFELLYDQTFSIENNVFKSLSDDRRMTTASVNEREKKMIALIG